MLNNIKKLFQTYNGVTIASEISKEHYYQGLKFLAEDDIKNAIMYFEKASDEIPSAAFNIALIYFNGAGTILPNFNLARIYFENADKLGHDRASYFLIILNCDLSSHTSKEEYLHLLKAASASFDLDHSSIGALAYLIACDVMRLIKLNHSLESFIDYEVWCIRNFANYQVKHFYAQSSLINWEFMFEDKWSWSQGDVDTISDYINTDVTPYIMFQCEQPIQLKDFGVMRLAMVNYIYEYYYK